MDVLRYSDVNNSDEETKCSAADSSVTVSAVTAIEITPQVAVATERELCPVIHTHQHLPPGETLTSVDNDAHACVHHAVWEIHCSADGQESPTSIVTTAASASDLTSQTGARVLVAQHGAGKQCRSFCHVQQLLHLHILALYGAHDTRLFVCQSGEPLSAFRASKHRPTMLLRALRDVMYGLRFMHDRGFAHGAVDEQHMFVGGDMHGKLLAHFCSHDASGSGIESESKTRAAPVEDDWLMDDEPVEDDWLMDDEPVDPDIRNKLVQDEAQFAEYVASVLTEWVPTEHSTKVTDWEKSLAAIQQLRLKTIELLSQVRANTSNEPMLQSSGAERAIQKLADLEAGLYADK